MSGSVSSEGVVATNIGVMAFIDVVELLAVVVVPTLLTGIGVGLGTGGLSLEFPGVPGSSWESRPRHSSTGHA